MAESQHISNLKGEHQISMMFTGTAANKWRPPAAPKNASLQHVARCRLSPLALLALLYALNALQSFKPSSALEPSSRSQDNQQDELGFIPSKQEVPPDSSRNSPLDLDKRAFVAELLRMLYEHYGVRLQNDKKLDSVLEERRSQLPPGQLGMGPQMMHQLLEALGADGDIRRLIDWISHSFSPASIPEVTTQFVVSKLGAVNCPALLPADKEDSLVPRFLLFNEHFVDVPFELGINPSPKECLANGKFDPSRKTILLIHGYLTGYTLVDGITNIKNRLLDLNRAINEQAINKFAQDSNAHLLNGTGYVYTEDLNSKIRHQTYNVILVDWFNGANPTPRANYIKSAVNAQVVGQLIARFISALIIQCGTPASSVQIIGHSLGCHVSGFTGKALNAAGHRLGKITHLDPVGLCFGRLFSQPRFRLSPDDAAETQAVHTSLNIFDNPLDGAHSNFLVNGGRDQAGCGGASELTNSTTSSIALLFDPAAKFGACSHMRALNLYEEDQSSELGQCQMVGYRCRSYDSFLAGKCGFCDSANSQCRLMGLAPVSLNFKQIHFAQPHADDINNFYATIHGHEDLNASSSARNNLTTTTVKRHNETVVHKHRVASSRSLRPEAAMQQQQERTVSAPIPASEMFGAPSYLLNLKSNEIAARRSSERRLALDKRDRIAQALERLRTETRTALADGWPNLRAHADLALDSTRNGEPIGGDEMEQSSSAVVVDTSSARLTAAATTTTTTTTSQTTTPLPPAMTSPTRGDIDKLAPDEATSRAINEAADHIPVGSQRVPAGSLHGPLYFLGTSAVASYCVNYYQFRVLVAERRLQKIIKNNGLGSNRLAPQLSQQSGHHLGGILTAAAASLQQRVANANGRDMLHLTVKLTDTTGKFFKGFSLLEHAHSLARVMNDFAPVAPLASAGPPPGLDEPMLELTMLLNSTRAQPQRVGAAIVSYYFHQIVLADRIEVNYMSNIAPEVRARYSSVLCPVAINDKHQLVRYVECPKVSPL